ncbi:hypothetical protein ZYGNAAKF_CDS0168 [Enterococcus phage VRE9_2]
MLCGTLQSQFNARLAPSSLITNTTIRDKPRKDDLFE